MEVYILVGAALPLEYREQAMASYSQVFDYVEIDSTFYSIPSELTVRNWNRTTPNNFRFTTKFPKIITHEK